MGNSFSLLYQIYLISRGYDHFFCETFSRMSVYEELVSHSGTKSKEAYCPTIKDPSSLSSGFLFCSATHCVGMCYFVLLTSPNGNWDLKNEHKKMLICWLLL